MLDCDVQVEVWTTESDAIDSVQTTVAREPSAEMAARARPRRLSAWAASLMAASAGVAASVRASAAFMKSVASPSSEGASRTTLAGEMAMAWTGRFPASRQTSETASAGRLASQQIASLEAIASRGPIRRR